MPAWDDLDQNETQQLLIDHRTKLRTMHKPWVDLVRDTWRPMLNTKGTGPMAWDTLATKKQSRDSKRLQALSAVKSPFISRATKNMISRLARSGIKIDVAIKGGATQEALSSELENMARGLIHQQDENVRSGVLGQSWLRLAAGFAAFPAKLTGLVRTKRRGESVDIEWELWDPTTVFHDFGKPNNHRVIHDFMIDADEARGLLASRNIPMPQVIKDKLKEAGAIAFTDYYLEEKLETRTRVWNAWLMDNIMVYAPKVMQGPMWDHLPVFAVALNGMPSLAQSNTMDRSTLSDNPGAVRSEYVEHHARPWFTEIVDAIHKLNLANSLELMAFWKAVEPPVIIESRQGNIFLQDELIGPNVQIPVTPEQALKYLESQRINTRDFGVIQQLREDALSEYPPHLLTGEAAFAGQAALHLFKQEDIAQIATLAFADGLSVFIKALLQETVHQIGKHHAVRPVKIRLSARGSKGELMGKYYEMDFDASKIPPSFSMDVRLSPQLPQDDKRALEMYSQAVNQGRFPMLDPLTGRAAFGGHLTDDPVAIGEKVRTSQAESIQPMVNEDALEVLDQRIEEADAAAKRKRNEGSTRRARAKVRRLKKRRADLEQMLRGEAGLQQTREIGGFSPAAGVSETEVEDRLPSLAGAGQQGRPRPSSDGARSA